MERRLILHEKLKGSKQKKITIKQGDVLVTLNLKTDLIDPNVDLADKVLFMLEAFAEKHQKTMESKNKPVEESSPKESEFKLISKFRSKDKLVSPSKRVRFDLGTQNAEEGSSSLLKGTELLVNTPEKSLVSSELNKIIENQQEITSTPSSQNEKIISPSESAIKKPNKRRIEDYFKTIPSPPKPDKALKKLEEAVESLPVKEAAKEMSQETLSIQKPELNIPIPEPVESKETKEAQVAEKTVNKDDSLINFQTNQNSTSNNTSNNSSNNTLDELLDELDKTNTQLTQVAEKIQSNEYELNKEAELPNTSNTFEINPQETPLQFHIEETATITKIPKQNIVASDMEVFKCRLCRLKLNNQRSLHEHVARIHGGKGGLFNSSLFTNENDAFNENEDDSDFDPIAKYSKNSRFKKHYPTDSMPHPNVAIRVAKIAYYNSKIPSSSSTSSSNAFKANIFTIGMRGNFFSQERLPLRSCKIKMKLKKSKMVQSPDNFLKHTNALTNIKPVDRNLTIITQNTVDNESEVNTDAEIRDFFKKLLVYIPNSSTGRLNDLIISNESVIKNDMVDYTESIRLIHEIILDGKQIGVTLYELKKSFDSKLDVLRNKMVKFKGLIQLLLDNFLVLSVGVVRRVYVAHQFKQHWSIQSVKNQKGRGFGLFDRSDEENELESNENCLEENKTNDELDNSLGRPRRKKPSPESMAAYSESQKTKQFKNVCLIPRPWRYIDGLLNRPVLQKMLETIVIYLKSYPHSTLDSIANHFCPVLQPVMSLELLEMLEKMRIVSKIVLKPESECSLFSDFQNGSSRLEDPDLEEGNEIFAYCCIQNSIFTIKKLFP